MSYLLWSSTDENSGERLVAEEGGGDEEEIFQGLTTDDEMMKRSCSRATDIDEELLGELSD